MRRNKRRVLAVAGAITALGAAATLILGVTFGLFSANQGSGTSSFTAGTVTLDTPVNATCTISNMAPGDQSSGFTPVNGAETSSPTAPCTFSVRYSGSLPAYLAVDTTLGGTSLYDGTSSGLQLQVSDGTTSYTTSGALNGLTDLLVSQTPDGGSSNTVHTFTVNYALPEAAGDTYQGLTTTLKFTVHAVQSTNNNFVGLCTAGDPCGSASNWG